MPSGAQTRSPQPRRRRLSLDVLEPPENDVFIFLHEMGRMEPSVGFCGVCGGGGVPFLFVYPLMSFPHPLGVCACVRVVCFLVTLLLTEDFINVCGITGER